MWLGANAAPEVGSLGESHCAMIFSLMGTSGPFTRLQPKSTGYQSVPSL